MTETERIKGRIKWFSKIKGYGFIISDGVEYFMHISHLRDDNDEFQEDDNCEFSIAQTEKGFAARDIIKTIGD